MKLRYRITAFCLAAALMLGGLPFGTVYAADDPTDTEIVQVDPETEPPSEEETEPAETPSEEEPEPTDPPSEEETEPTETPSEEETEPTETPSEEETEPAETPSEEETEPTDPPSEEETEPTETSSEEETEPTETSSEEETEPEETEPAEAPSVDLDALTQWVQEQPEQLSALYGEDAAAVAALAAALGAEEDTVRICVADLKGQNDALVQALEDGTDVLNTISMSTAEDAAAALGVDVTAIDLFGIKLGYVSGLLSEAMDAAEENDQLADWYQQLGAALGDEETLAQTAQEYDVEPAVLAALLQSMGVEAVAEQTLPSLTLTNVELDIPDGVNDQFTYNIYVWTTSSSGSINSVVGTYGAATFTQVRYTYMQAYSAGLPYGGYYNYFGYGQVVLSAGQSAVIAGLPEGCSYMILAGASSNYYVKSLTSTYGTVSEQMGTVYVEGASGANEVICVNDYAPNSIRLGAEVMSRDPNSVDDEFEFTIYLYSHSSSGNTPLFQGDEVAVDISAEGTNGVEAPVLGNGDTLTFTTTKESVTLPGLSVAGTYNVATVKLKHGQSVVLKHLGSNFGCYIAQTPDLHYTLYQLKTRHVYVSNMDDFVGSYDGYYEYINACSVSSSVCFTNAQETLSITKEVDGSDTDREFTFNVYFLNHALEGGYLYSMPEGEFKLTYTNPTGDEPETAMAQLGTDHSKTSHFTITSTGYSYDAEWTAMQIKLAAGQTVTIEDLPAVIAYYIEEVPVGNYTLTSATTTDANGVVTDGYDVYSLYLDTDEAASFTNTYTPPEDGVNLTVSKTVTGNFADPNGTFPFTISLTDGDGNPLSDLDVEVLLPGQTEATIYTTDADGQITVNLMDSQQVTLQDLPQGTQYTVVENEASDYETTFDVTGGSADPSEGQTQSGALDSADDVTVHVTNDRSVVVPTGVRVEVQSSVTAIALALGALLLLIGGKYFPLIAAKRRKEQ
jgi:hypothetical protein